LIIISGQLNAPTGAKTLITLQHLNANELLELTGSMPVFTILNQPSHAKITVNRGVLDDIAFHSMQCSMTVEFWGKKLFFYFKKGKLARNWAESVVHKKTCFFLNCALSPYWCWISLKFHLIKQWLYKSFWYLGCRWKDKGASRSATSFGEQQRRVHTYRCPVWQCADRSRTSQCDQCHHGQRQLHLHVILLIKRKSTWTSVPTSCWLRSSAGFCRLHRPFLFSLFMHCPCRSSKYVHVFRNTQRFFTFAFFSLSQTLVFCQSFTAQTEADIS